ncbi:CBS domain-containing protein [Pelagerythrobacter aerophilus]|uniref:CBS domain-containing protein n=1 Tax=Pelagerythrobacter aerophilus TaxID=2306995 RepID=A0A418NLL8_9SPHN|nr:CBS domain-containing protein [Pelagerythrobacter aerophilus]RIV75971.1 CBS domain-containing protein [Pelagerythrobacter aerophilus]RIV80774.1 CBS domain-containing protein [Pelagerythrobacter aerophilus]
MDIASLIVGRARADIVQCEAATRMRDAVALLAERRIGAMPVMEGGRVAGIFSERDVLYCVAKEGAAAFDRTVGEVMTAPAITVSPKTKVDEAMALMTRRRVRHLPVVDGEVMCGFISIGDLVKSRIDEVERDAAAMRDYIRTA